MNIIAVVSAMGGVGKTTFGANFSIAMARLGVPTLAIDLAPQDALQLHFSASEPTDQGLVQATLAGKNWRSALLRTPNACELLPYGRVQEASREAFEQRLREQPQLLRNNLQQLNLPANAVVVIDTPPGPSIYLSQALAACNTAVIALLSDAASYATVPRMLGLVQRYCLDRPDFNDYAFLINQVDSSRQLNSDVAHLMRVQFGARALSIVHQDQAVPEALACHQFVGDYDPLCRAAHDLSAVCEQLLTRVPVGSRAAA